MDEIGRSFRDLQKNAEVISSINNEVLPEIMSRLEIYDRQSRLHAQKANHYLEKAQHFTDLVMVFDAPAEWPAWKSLGSLSDLDNKP